MKRLICDVLSQDVFETDPPICIDIGASGKLPREWRYIAPYSVCVAFDADLRDFEVAESTTAGWKKLYKLNRLVTDCSFPALDFYLTNSPYCSSSLPPDNVALNAWAFWELFEVERTIVMPSVSISEALGDLNINRIDWYKTDSQGTDLRIFASLSDEIITNVIVADFEPGIMDAYKGEDKLCAVMQFMDKKPFFVSDMVLSGSQRIHRDLIDQNPVFKTRFLSLMLKTAPGWCGISYLNNADGFMASKRALMLTWVCSSIKEHHGHALWVAARGLEMFGDQIFAVCKQASIAKIRAQYPVAVLSRIKQKFRGLINKFSV